MAAPDEDVYTLCIGTDPQVSKDAARLRDHDSHDPGVRLALELDNQTRAWLEDYVNSGKIPTPEEIELFWNAYVERHMDLVGDDHGNCGNPLDKKKCHAFLNFGTNETRERRPGQTRGDRIALNNHTFVFLRNYAVFVALREGGTPEDKLTAAIAAEAFDEIVSYSDYYQVSCDGTPECPRGNKWRECFEPQLVKDAEVRGLSGKSKDEKLCVHNVQARGALAVRALHSIAVGNEKLTVLMASDRSNDKLFKNPNREPIVALLVHIFLTSHPSTFPAQLRHPGNYPLEELERMTKHFLEFLQVVFAGAVLPDGTQLSLPSSAEEFKLFFKLAGRGDLSPAEMEALLEALHAARVRGGKKGGTTTAYSKGLDARGKCVAMVERGALGGKAGTSDCTLQIERAIISLAEDTSWDMIVPGGADLSNVCAATNAVRRRYEIAMALSSEELFLHEPQLLEHRYLTEDEEAAVRRDADGDEDEALKKALEMKRKRFQGLLGNVRNRATQALKDDGQAVPKRVTHGGAAALTQILEQAIHSLANDPNFTLPTAALKLYGRQRRIENQGKLSVDAVQRQYEIAKFMTPAVLVSIKPELLPHLALTDAEEEGLSKAEKKKKANAKRSKFHESLSSVLRRAEKAKKAAEQAAAEEGVLLAPISSGEEDGSSLVESLEGAVPQYVERWTCDKCQWRSFETFEAAHAHEAECEALAPPLPPPVLEPGSPFLTYSDTSYPCNPTHFDPSSISYYGHPRSNSQWDLCLHYNFNQSYLVNQRYDYLCPIPPDWKKRLDEMRAAESAQLTQSDAQSVVQSVVQPPVAADLAVPEETRRELKAEARPMSVERWTCDKCRLASFDTFEEAHAHEAQCISLAHQAAPPIATPPALCPPTEANEEDNDDSDFSDMPFVGGDSAKATKGALAIESSPTERSSSTAVCSSRFSDDFSSDFDTHTAAEAREAEHTITDSESKLSSENEMDILSFFSKQGGEQVVSSSGSDESSDVDSVDRAIFSSFSDVSATNTPVGSDSAMATERPLAIEADSTKQPSAPIVRNPDFVCDECKFAYQNFYACDTLAALEAHKTWCPFVQARKKHRR